MNLFLFTTCYLLSQLILLVVCMSDNPDAGFSKCQFTIAQSSGFLSSARLRTRCGFGSDIIVHIPIEKSKTISLRVVNVTGIVSINPLYARLSAKKSYPLYWSAFGPYAMINIPFNAELSAILSEVCLFQQTSRTGYISSPVHFSRCIWHVILAASPTQKKGQLRLLKNDLSRHSELLIIDNSTGLKQINFRTSLADFPITTGPRFEIRYTCSQSPCGSFNLSYQEKGICLAGQGHCVGEQDCFSLADRCNGYWDCPRSGFDERTCPCNKSRGKYSCGDGSHCYPSYERCNGRAVCVQNNLYSDEQNCDRSKCSEKKGLFLCRDKRCIYESYVCDGSNDCTDKSDEEFCNVILSRKIITSLSIGGLVCSTLLCIALGCLRRLYMARQRTRQLLLRSCRRFANSAHRLPPELRNRIAPPRYNEAMRTSRPYDEVWREFLRQRNEDAASTSNEVDNDDLLSTEIISVNTDSAPNSPMTIQQTCSNEESPSRNGSQFAHAMPLHVRDQDTDSVLSGGANGSVLWQRCSNDTAASGLSRREIPSSECQHKKTTTADNNSSGHEPKDPVSNNISADAAADGKNTATEGRLDENGVAAISSVVTCNSTEMSRDLNDDDDDRLSDLQRNSVDIGSEVGSITSRDDVPLLSL